MSEDNRQENGKDYIIRHLTFFPFNIKIRSCVAFRFKQKATEAEDSKQQF